jgi:hypothetical protein
MGLGWIGFKKSHRGIEVMASYFDRFLPKFSPPPCDIERLRVQTFLHRLKLHLQDRGLAADAVPSLDRRTGELERFANQWRDFVVDKFFLPEDTSWEQALHTVFYVLRPMQMPPATNRNPHSMFEHFRC